MQTPQGNTNTSCWKVRENVVLARILILRISRACRPSRNTETHTTSFETSQDSPKNLMPKVWQACGPSKNTRTQTRTMQTPQDNTNTSCWKVRENVALARILILRISRTCRPYRNTEMCTSSFKTSQGNPKKTHAKILASMSSFKKTQRRKHAPSIPPQDNTDTPYWRVRENFVLTLT